uniref:hypothetical protein n=1 Tax=Pseudomonas syringae TaxID=317 RepID=UPI003CECACE5
LHLVLWKKRDKEEENVLGGRFKKVNYDISQPHHVRSFVPQILKPKDNNVKGRQVNLRGY